MSHRYRINTRVKQVSVTDLLCIALDKRSRIVVLSELCDTRARPYALREKETGTRRHNHQVTEAVDHTTN